MFSARYTVLALWLMGSAALCALAADGKSEPGITGAEREALSRTLEFAGLSPSDLDFRKDHAAARLTIAAVVEALTDPLRGVATADGLSAALSSAGPAECMSALGRAISEAASPHEATGPAQPPGAGADQAAIRSWLAPIAPKDGFSDDDIDRVASLPDALKEALGWFIAILPSADADLSAAFLDLTAEETELLRQFGLMLTIADDEVRDRFMPPDPVKATALLAARQEAPAMAALLGAAGKVDVDSVARAGALMAALASGIRASLEGKDLTGFGDSSGYALDLQTRFGVLRIAGRRNDVHEQGPSFLIDLGGDDVYRGTGFGAASAISDRRLSLLVDMDGDDVYMSPGRVQLGAAFMGAAALLDCRGNDFYSGSDVCLGAAVLGSAMLIDDGGSDSFRSREFSQGAAAFGAALLLSDAPGGQGNDSYRAEVFSQGLSRTMAAAALVDRGGHDSYFAGSGRLYRPQSKTRHYSHSQGFAIGVREFGAGGGVAMLLDTSGNDSYQGEIHAQGSACWMGLGILVDLEGDDRYACTFNGQGAAVHQSVGILIDEAGDDSYTIDDGIGQGAAHDFACGVLCDRGGNDKYAGRAAVQGVGLTDGIGILIERSGDDLYAAQTGHFQGAARGTRNYRSVGVLVDMSGRDTYTATPESIGGEARADLRGWTAGSTGTGFDAGGAPAPAATDPFPGLPDGYEFTKEKFDALFATASMWVVGENVGKTAAAKAELSCWGAKALPFLREEMKKWGTLHFWALDSVAAGVHARAPEETAAMILGCFSGGDGASQANALRLCGKLKIAAAGPVVISMLAADYWSSWAIWPAGQLRLKEAAPAIAGMLSARPGAPDATEAVVALCKIAESSTLGAVIQALEGGDFAAREAAVANLWRFGAPAYEALASASANLEKPKRARVASARALARFAPGARGNGCDAIATALLADHDWAVRSAAAMLAATGAKQDEAKAAIRSALGSETHPFARTAMTKALRVASGDLSGMREPVSGVVEYPLLLEDD